MDSSRGFGSVHRHYLASADAMRPVQTRFRSGCRALPLVSRATTNYSPDHSTKCTPSVLSGTVPQCPLTAGAYVVSGSLSSPLRGAFHLSLTVLVHYRSLKVFSLGGWSPLLPTNSPGFVVLRMPASARCGVPTGLSPPVVASSNAFGYATLTCCRSYNPALTTVSTVWAPPASLATTTGISACSLFLVLLSSFNP